MIRTIHAIIFLLFSVFSFGHTGTIKVQVLDGQNKRTLAGVHIIVDELGRDEITDLFGVGLFQEIMPAQYHLTIQFIGYNTYNASVAVVDGETQYLTIYLETKSIAIEEVVIKSPIDQNLSSVSALDIETRPTNSTQDMLRIVPGLFIAQHAGGGKAEQIFLRGFDIDHGTDINIAVDGMPVNMVSHAHGQGYADLHFLIPESVDHVDFGKGPYRLEKGNLATAGYVEFKTKRFLDEDFAKAELGMFNTRRFVSGLTLLNTDNQGINQNAYAICEFLGGDGYFDASQNFTRFNLFTKYSKQSKSNIFNVSLSAFRSSWDASGQIPERAVQQGLLRRFGQLAPGEGGQTTRYNANLNYVKSIDNQQSLKTNIWLGYYDFQLFSDFTFFLNDPINGDQIMQKERRFLYGFEEKYENKFQLGQLPSSIYIGIGMRNDQTYDTELSRTLNRLIVTNPLALGDIKENNVFAYVGHTLDMSSKFKLNYGLRYDYFQHNYFDKLETKYSNNSAAGGVLSPKLNLTYDFTNRIRFYSSSGIGFHSNDTRVVVIQKGINILPKAYSTDIGANVKLNKFTFLTLAAWYLELEDEFVYVGDEAVVESGGRTRRYGADLGLRADIFSWLYADFDLNITNARSTASLESNLIPLAANFTSIGGLTARFGSFLSSIRYRYLGDRPANEDNSVIAKGYGLVDVVVKYSVKRFDFGIQIENLLNAEWNEAQFDTESKMFNESESVSEIHFTPGTPFSFRGSVTYKF